VAVAGLGCDHGKRQQNEKIQPNAVLVFKFHPSHPPTERDGCPAATEAAYPVMVK
jgi:hypothetical protein